jgi:hypothetical protein
VEAAEITHSLPATVALLLWIPFSLLVFAMAKPHRAAAFLFVFGTLFLPEREYFDIRLLPNMNKKTIVCAWVFCGALLWARSRLKRADLGRMPWFLFGLMLVVDVGRALTNHDPLSVGGTLIPAIMPHTALTFMMEDFLVVFVPFFIGAALFRDRDTLRSFMRTFAVGGLIYIPFVAVELRLSPQWHAWIYGFHQHSWLQVLRDGAYRPMVFMQHGLAVALFMTTCTVLMFGLGRAREKIGAISATPLAILLALVVAAMHSKGALLFVVLFVPLVWFSSPKWQLWIAGLVALLVMLYPMLRAYDYVPTKALFEGMRSMFGADRAGSLEFRFRNEDMALARALERPMFGWGGFDRMFVFDKETGNGLSTLDGYWVITYAASGALGFISRFGLLTWPVWQAYRRLRKVPMKADQFLIATLGVATAMISADLIPNGMFTYFPHLFAGVLLGATRQLSRQEAVAPERVVAKRRRPAPVPASA